MQMGYTYSNNTDYRSNDEKDDNVGGEGRKKKRLKEREIQTDRQRHRERGREREFPLSDSKLTG